jgi:predicted TIM-barrel fold metal-dependent hydrolase
MWEDRVMDITALGAIDCDLHPELPGMATLLPYLDDYWRETLVTRGVDRSNLSLIAYPPGAPLCGRPDWRPARGKPGTDLGMLQRQALDAFGTRFGILNPISAVQLLPSEDMAAVLCRAMNDWIAAEWLDRDPRLRASILVPAHGPDLAVEEIERRAGDPRFVQVLLLAMGEAPLGRRQFWPIYRAAERHGLPIGIHAGSEYRHAPTSIGWPSYFLEDYVAQSQAFEAQLLSLIAEGVFSKFPALKVVMIESGFAWLPGFLWRINKTWRGVRAEVPWVDRPPSEIVRDQVRVTLQPVDEPPDPAQLAIVIEQLGSDRMLLFSTDYPHWQFDGTATLPAGLPEALARRIAVDNPLETYTRLHQPAHAKEAV